MNRDENLKKFFLLLNKINKIISDSSFERKMLDSICKEMTESKIFTRAVIIRTEELKGYLSFSASGALINLKELEKKFKKGFLPECVFKSGFEKSWFLIDSPLKSCKSCICTNNPDEFSVCIKLKFFEKNYGFLICSFKSANSDILTGNNLYEFDFIEKIGKDISRQLKHFDLLDEKNLYLNEIIEYSNELQTLYSSIPMTMAVLDNKRQIVKINSYAEKIFNKNESQSKGLKPGDFFCCKHRFDSKLGCGFGKECAECKINNSILKTSESKKTLEQVEGKIEIEEKGKLNILISTIPVTYSSKEYVLVLIEDVTSLKIAWKFAEEKTSSLAQLVESMKSGVAVYEYNTKENDFIIKDFNKAAETIEKVKKKDVIGQSLTKVFPGVIESGFFDCFLEVFKSGIPKKFNEVLYKDSRISGWRDNYIYRLENKNIVAVYDDITERKKAEEKIKLQKKDLEIKEKEYRDIFNHSPVGIFQTTFEGRPLNVNPAMAKILGCKNVEEVFNNYETLAKDLYVDPRRRKEFIELLKKNKKVQNFVYEGKTIDKKSVWLEMSASISKKGENAIVEGFTRDITKEHKALFDLKISEEKFSRVFFLGSALLSISDLKNGKYIDVNSSFSRKTGYSKNEILGFTGSELGIITKETKDKIYSIINSKGRINDLEIDFFNKKGERFYGLYSGDIILLNSKPCLLSTTFDITERKIYEQEATRAGQLALIGELAAGVAHEINNPINGIINYAQILNDEFEEEGRENDIALRIIKEGERISKIAGSLLNFAGNQKEELLDINLSDVLRETLYLGEVQIKKDGISLINEFPANLPFVKARPRELSQVFFNIFLNSRYALNEKFPLSSNEKIFKITGSLVNKEKRQFVKIEFFDSGTGVPPEILNKIKSPFFTNKPKGLGTGLGLSISSSIIERHFGNLEIESVFNKYTKVVIELPVSHGKDNFGEFL